MASERNAYVRLPEDLVARVDEWADNDGERKLSRASAIVALVRRALDEIDRKAEQRKARA